MPTMATTTVTTTRMAVADEMVIAETMMGTIEIPMTTTMGTTGTMTIPTVAMKNSREPAANQWTMFLTAAMGKTLRAMLTLLKPWQFMLDQERIFTKMLI